MRRRVKRGFVGNVLLPLAAGLSISVAALVGAAALLDVAIGPAGPAGEAAASTGGEETSAVAALEEEVETVGPPDRDVTPPGVTPGPRVEGVLKRKRRPVTEITLGQRDPETVFRRVVVLDGGSFRAVVDKTPVVVHLAGVRAPAFKDECMDEAGRSWKCGARARAELARLILNRPVACVVPPDADKAAPLARCRVGMFDVSEWMIQHGWVDPADGAPEALVDLGAEARTNKRGRYGPAPSGVVAG